VIYKECLCPLPIVTNDFLVQKKLFETLQLDRNKPFSN